MTPRFSREQLQVELEAVAKRHGLELVKIDGQGMFLDADRDLFTVRLVPAPVEGCERPCCNPERAQ